MKKFYLFMLMAVGLLISGNVGAAAVGSPTNDPSVIPDGAKYARLETDGWQFYDDQTITDDESNDTELIICCGNNLVTINDPAIKNLTVLAESQAKMGIDVTIYGTFDNKGKINPSKPTPLGTMTLSTNAKLENNGFIKYLNITGNGTIINNDSICAYASYINVPSWENYGGLHTESAMPIVNGDTAIFTLPNPRGRILVATTVITSGTNKGASRGRFNANPQQYIKDKTKYHAEEDPRGFWVIASGPAPDVEPEEPDVIQIGTTKYKSWADAYAAAADNSTLTLLADITLSANTTLDKNITIDKGSSYKFIVAEGATLTVNSGKTLTVAGSSQNGITVQGTLVVNGTVTRGEKWGGTTTTINNVIIVDGTNAVLNVNGGSVLSSFNVHGTPIYIKQASSVSLTNNAVVTNTKPAGENDGMGSYGLYIAAMPATMTVDGVTITSYDNAIYNKVAGSTCTLTSGKFSALGSSAVLNGNITAAKGTQFNKEISSDFFDAEQYICKEVSTGLWEIVDKPVAPIAVDFLQIGATKYNSFESMVAALQDNDVITVIADAKILALTAVTIEKNNVTLNMNGHKLTVDPQLIGSISSYTDGGMYAFNITGSLTVNGDANSLISVPGGMFKVEEGAELTINGGEYETLIIPVPTKIVKNSGTLAINAATMNAAAGCIENYGVANIDGGTYTSKSTHLKPTGYSGIDYYDLYYCYGVINNAVMNISNSTIKGVHGALGCETEGARLTVRNCEVSAARSQGYTENDSHAALYVCTYAIADVYNSSFKSERENYSVYVGNNDMTKQWGVVNLYAGTKLAHKAYVQTAKTADATFNPIVPKNSAWYTIWQVGSHEAPLPDGYTYASINEDGYAWVVNGPADKQEESVVVTAETIPWNQTSTWSNSEVPTEATIATIPDKKVVVIGENTEAEAYQVFIGGNNAKLTVSEDAFLTVGDGGMNIAEGGQMIIEPGAVVKVGAAGVINSSDEAIIIKAEQGKSGAFLIGPAVTEATHPYATVEMYTRAREISTVEHRWQHFAIPTIGKPSVTPLPHDHESDANFIYIYEWNYTSKAWETLGSWDKLNTPFKGYDLTNNLPADTYASQGGVTYVFHGNIIGNGDGDLKFLSKGYNFFGNSYTAPIDIKTMFNSLDASVEKTIAIYDVESNQYVYSNEAMINLGFTNNTQISPLQGFFLNLRDKSSLDDQINYTNAVYNNPNLTAGHGGIFAPRQQEAFEANAVAIQVEAEGNADEIVLIAMNDLTADFENGFDATKLMNESNLNIYANTMAGKLGVVATNDLMGTTMDFQSNDATQYTMTFSNVKGQVYELIDVMTGIRTRMEEGTTYTFNAEANSLVPNRFQVCEAAKAPTSMENVKAAAKGIYTVLGQPVGNNWMSLPAGVYIVNGVRVVK